MKRKKMFFIIAAVVLAAFFFIIDTMKGIQSNIEYKKNLTDSEKFMDKFGTNEIYSFDDIVSKADFGEFVIMRFGFAAITDQSPFYNTIFQNGSYYYRDNDLINQVTEVLKEYDYTYSTYDFSEEEGRENLWSCVLQGYNGIYLHLAAYSTMDENTIYIYIFTTDEFETSTPASEWFEKHYLGMLVEGELSEKLLEILQENTARISLSEVNQIIEENVGELPLYKMLSYENSLYELYIDNPNGDAYYIYKQQLEDSDDYLLVSLMNSVSPETYDQDIYIFKIELYQEDGTLKEVLFDDTQRYEADKP